MLILLTGLPGSGKSTVAQMLATELNAVVLNTDQTRRELFPKSRTYSSKETQAVIEETKQRTTQYLEDGRIVILDALFTKQRPRDEYYVLANKLGVQFKVIHVSAPEGLIQQRLLARQDSGDASEATFEYYLDRKPHYEAVSGEYFSIYNSGDLAELKTEVRAIASRLI